MKLKLTTKPLAASDGAPVPSPSNEAPTPGGSAPKLKFKLAPSAAVSGDTVEAPKAKRKYTKKPKFDENGNLIAPTTKAVNPKKRPREETGDDGNRSTKRKIKPTFKTLERTASDDELDEEMQTAPPPRAPVRQSSMLKIRMKPSGGSTQQKGVSIVKFKGVVGKPPVRPPGVGYDSEAEEAEVDPAIESQFVLRMQPGPDCDLVRKAIEEKKIGKPQAEGGTNVIFRFFDREGRRAMVNVQGRLYAATMVDLPCVIESMKSWNKRDWVKTADVCQMLLILGPVQSEEEAKKFPLPKEVDPHKHQYPHGLTPPMHWVRKRRFRPRQSYHEIEQREAQVQALLEADELAEQNGGKATWEIIDDRAESTEEETSEEDGEGEEDVAETTEYVLQNEAGEEVEIDNNELEAALAAGLMEDEEDADALFGEGEAEVEVETPITAHDVAAHALGDNAVSTPDEDESEDEDVETPGDQEVDAEAAAAQEGLEQGLAEVRELEQEIAKAQEQLEQTGNILYKQRCKKKIEQLQTDLGLKKAALGLGDDGD